jgi:hypothetical protein
VFASHALHAYTLTVCGIVVIRCLSEYNITRLDVWVDDRQPARVHVQLMILNFPFRWSGFALVEVKTGLLHVKCFDKILEYEP